MIRELRETVDRDPNDNVPSIFGTAAYSAIRPHLTAGAIKGLEQVDIHAVAGRTARPVSHRTIILDELSRLEREWKLV